VHSLHLWRQAHGHAPGGHGGPKRDRVLVGILSGVLPLYLSVPVLTRDRAR